MYHSAVLQGFDANNWVQEVWVRELLESDTQQNDYSIKEECSDSSDNNSNGY